MLVANQTLDQNRQKFCVFWSFFPCHNYSQGPPAEKTGRWPLLNHPSCDPQQPYQSRDWTEPLGTLFCSPISHRRWFVTRYFKMSILPALQHHLPGTPVGMGIFSQSQLEAPYSSAARTCLCSEFDPWNIIGKSPVKADTDQTIQTQRNINTE